MQKSQERIKHFAKNRITLAIVSSVIFSCSLSTYAQEAQEETQDTTEIITISATKRSANLQEVPISVQVVGGKDIEKNNIVNLEDLSDNLPAITITQTVAGNSIYMRGVGSGTSPGFQQSVGTFIDGIYMGRSAQSRASFADIQQVEVLRGPQSTYFGNNTIGGALNVITRSPDEIEEGNIAFTYVPGDGELSLDAGYSTPITNDLAVRGAIRYYKLDGWMTNSVQNWTTGESTSIDVPQSESLSGRVTVKYTPNDDIDMLYKVEIGDFREDYNSIEVWGCTEEVAQAVGGRTPQNPNCNTDTLAIPGYEADFNLNAVSGGTSEGYDEVFTDLQTHNQSLKIDYRFNDGFTATSITGYSTYDSIRGIDPDASPWDTLHAFRTEEFDQFSQEFRVVSPNEGTLTYLAGVFFDNTNLDTSVINRAPTVIGGGPQVGTTDYASGIGYEQIYSEDTHSVAAFGALTWQITDDISSTLGLRYTDVTKEGDLATENYFLVDGEFGASLDCNIVLGPPCVGPTASRDNYSIKRENSFSDFNQTFDIQWQMTDDVMLYASYRNGFKAGGFDPLVLNQERAEGGAFEFDSEEVDAYEVGAKSILLDGNLTLNVAIFDSEYENLQVSVFDEATLAFFVQNAAKAESKGIELESRWSLNNYFTLFSSFTFLDASYSEWKDEFTSQDIVPPGEPTEFAPDYSGNITLKFSHEISSDKEFAASVGMNFTDEYKTSTSLLPDIIVEEYQRYDLRVGINSLDGWDIALVGKNITDERIWRVAGSAVQGSGTFFAFADRGRSIALQGSYNF